MAVVVDFILRDDNDDDNDDDDDNDESAGSSSSSCSTAFFCVGRTAFFCVGRSHNWLEPIIEIMDLPTTLLLTPRPRKDEGDDGDNN
jgi:hypothetical protein